MLGNASVRRTHISKNLKKVKKQVNTVFWRKSTTSWGKSQCKSPEALSMGHKVRKSLNSLEALSNHTHLPFLNPSFSSQSGRLQTNLIYRFLNNYLPNLYDGMLYLLTTWKVFFFCFVLFLFGVITFKWESSQKSFNIQLGLSYHVASLGPHDSVII